MSQTPLDLATLHIIRGAEIIARQYEVVARLRAIGADPTAAEEMLSVFIASQRIFEEHRSTLGEKQLNDEAVLT